MTETSMTPGQSPVDNKCNCEGLLHELNPAKPTHKLTYLDPGRSGKR